MEYCENCKKKTQHYMQVYPKTYMLDENQACVCSVCGWCLHGGGFFQDKVKKIKESKAYKDFQSMLGEKSR
jgi:hypothetical protein